MDPRRRTKDTDAYEFLSDLSSFLEEHDLEHELHGLVAVLRRRTTGAPCDLVVMAHSDLQMLVGAFEHGIEA